MTLTYSAVHKRVRRARGSASKYNCVDCGNQAHHWSYSNNDPDEVILVAHDGSKFRGSLRIEFYEPRCGGCHIVEDGKLGDLVGVVVNGWTVLRREGSDTNGNARWMCVCNCGARKVILGFALRAGATNSCMLCSWVGKTFNSLTVKEFYGTRSKRRYWTCVCVCGRTTAVRADALKNGNTKTCGYCNLTKVGELKSR